MNEDDYKKILELEKDVESLKGILQAYKTIFDDINNRISILERKD